MFTVGGEKRHYDNMAKSIRSLERLTFVPTIHIYDMNQRGLTVTNESAWESKYHAVLEVENDYVVYLDSDTVLIKDNFEQLFERTKGEFSIAAHWYVQDIEDYILKCCKPDVHDRIRAHLKHGYRNLFPAAGAFMYKNTEASRKIVQDILELYKVLREENNGDMTGLTDELIVGALVKPLLHSSFNFSFMDRQKLGILSDNTLVGGSDFEESWDTIVLGHCDCFRRDPSLRVNKPENKALIRKLFYMD